MLISRIGRGFIKTIKASVNNAGRKICPEFMIYRKSTKGYLPTELTPAIVKELNALPQDNFWGRSVQILAEKFNLPFAPAIVQVKRLPNGVLGSYNKSLNRIYISIDDVAKLPRAKQYAILSHEMTHAKQCSDLLRTPVYGDALLEHAIEDASRITLGENRWGALLPKKLKKSHWKNFSKEVRDFWKLMRSGKLTDSEFEEALKTEYSSVLKNYRDAIVAKMGMLPELQGFEAELAQKNCRYLIEGSGLSNFKTMLRYYLQPLEIQALATQNKAAQKYSQLNVSG